jgi:hypothetical protein
MDCSSIYLVHRAEYRPYSGHEAGDRIWQNASRNQNPSTRGLDSPQLCRTQIRRPQWKDLPGCLCHGGDGGPEVGRVCAVSSLPGIALKPEGADKRQ